MTDVVILCVMLAVTEAKSTLMEEQGAAAVWVPPMPAGDWPVTVTRLISPSGGEVFLVGTAHFSRESQEDVAKVLYYIKVCNIKVFNL